jgi:FKBP-type peptidyl-prolyl cis-trans isomerase FklB
MKMKMKQMQRLAWITSLGIGVLAAQLSAQEAPVLKTEKDKISYGIGADMARNFKRQGVEFDVDLVMKGLKDGMSGGKLLMSQKELRKTMNDFQSDLRQRQAQNMRTASQGNKKKGEAFLAENKTKDGVVTLPSGLQYQILKAGAGKKPTEADTVEVIYRGTLLDGTEFDSSEGQPATFKVKGPGVIGGWTEALRLMPVGSKWKMFIPPPLAYGARGAGRDIGPNETIVFEMELVTIK